MSDDASENARLRRAFDEMRKTRGHGETMPQRHNSVRPEWVMRIIAEPYERYEIHTPEGERRTVIIGRVPESQQWIMVVFVGDSETGEFLTAYHRKQLARVYGGRPWEIP